MLLPNRNGSSDSYRYGFNSMEKDDEVKGRGNSYTTHFRQYDPRIGRWLTIDPKAVFWESPYAENRNNPLYFTDPNGDCPNGNCDDVTTPGGDRVSIPKGMAKHINGSGQVYSFMSQGREFFYDSRDGSYYDVYENRYSEKFTIDLSFKTRFEKALQNKVAKILEENPYAQIELDKSDDASISINKFLESKTAEDGHVWDFYQTLDVVNKADYPEVGLGESFVPVWGSGKSALYDFQDGEYGMALLNSGLAISEVFGIGYLRKAGYNVLGKLPQGGKAFSTYKKARGGTKTLGFIETTGSNGQIVFQRISTEYHHLFITQRTQRLYNLPNWIVNNRFNVVRLNTIQHSLIDPFRFRFLRKGLKSDVGFFKKYNWFTHNFD